MGKKKFDKKNAQHFWVLHRSQTDETRHIVDGQVSEHVLVPVENLNQARRRRAQEQKAEELLNLPVDELFRRGDHINQYGLPNDGYDYSSHFKEMGCGKFLSASGRVADPGIQARRVELPEEVLPGQDMDRMLQHITISEICMDPDLHDALFASDDEEGEGGFEELLDDFVVQASQAPAEPPADGFDFDAHIAKLIAASQMELESRLPARGWEDGIDKSRIIHRPEGGQLDDEDEFFEDDEFDEEDEEFDGEVAPSADPLLEGKFEETMKEYEDEEIGDLEDYADDESMDGRVDIYDDAAFNDALDDFLATQRDLNDESIRSKPSKSSAAKADDASADEAASRQEARGKKKDYSILLADPAAAAGGAKGAEEEADAEEPDLQKELTPAQRAALEAEEAEEAEEVLASHEYLGAERPKLEWDCETILSTYSVLDNHPTMIKLPSKKKAGRANGAAKATNGAANTAAATQPAKGSVTVAPQRIILSKAGLPTEFLPERQTAKAVSGISLSEVTPVSTDKPVVDTSGGRRGETKEERKERKAKFKQEQKERRGRKKATREVFKQEEQQQLRRLANASTAQENVPVHRFA